MSDNKRSGNSFGAKGYYIALILCAAAIGITGYLYARSANEPTPVSLPETQAEEVFLVPQEQQDVPVLATQPRDPDPVPTQTVPQTTAREPMKTVSPVSGEPVFGYSMEALSYNQTTRDWRIHSGIDLAAETGSPVCAAADGEVYTVVEDDSYGHTVIIRHNEGFTTSYASLSDDIPVRPGDRVTMGQTIGYTSDSAIVETTMGSHVHFSVTCYNEPMDPMDFLAMGQ
jgi:murein DD-endopeptidase MepM/ murein hydrolase activator NlpD